MLETIKPGVPRGFFHDLRDRFAWWRRPMIASASAGALRFRPRLWPTLATLAALAVLLGLGTWQVQRLHWKEGLIAERAAQLAVPPAPLPADAEDWRAFDFRRVSVTGAFRHDLEQLFGAYAVDGQFGQHVLTPLVRQDGLAVLVDRGWVPADKAHPATRRAGELQGEVAVTGIARYRADARPGWFTPDNQPGQRIWYWYDLPALEATVGMKLAPVVVEADATPNPGGLPIGGQTVIALPNNHLQYAITWYGLAVVLVAVYVAFSLQRPEERG
jgi:surfeit locus 1 family protein